MGEPVFLHIGRVHSERFWAMPAHRHEQFSEMICVLGGEIETHIDGKVLHGKAGDVLLYPRAITHSERSVGRAMLQTVFLAFRTNDEERDWPLTHRDGAGRIATLMNWMHAIVTSNNRERPILGHLLHGVVHEYRSLNQDPDAERIDRVKQYVQDHLTEPLNIDQLAEQAKLSRFHFAHAFQRSTGISPMRYVRGARIQAARTLLLSTDLQHKAIAERVGFPDEFQFCRVFKRVTGVSPGSLRR